MSTTTVQEIETAADALVAAFAEGRLDDYFGAFAPEATFVFHTTPKRLGSTAEYRALWQEWVEQDAFRILGCTSSAQLVQPFGDTAVFSHDVETRVATNSGEQTVHERETIVFARSEDGAWLAVHEHLSPRTAA
ncbi:MULTISPECIES: nuclear transport factor 2 family protein [unclassified Streptomyces]|uniref:YybH family protein n=1 Tax=unclassified Streptomyces TaxID=2593676 RepID=UPI00343CD76E